MSPTGVNINTSLTTTKDLGVDNKAIDVFHSSMWQPPTTATICGSSPPDAAVCSTEQDESTVTARTAHYNVSAWK